MKTTASFFFPVARDLWFVMVHEVDDDQVSDRNDTCK